MPVPPLGPQNVQMWHGAYPAPSFGGPNFFANLSAFNGGTPGNPYQPIQNGLTPPGANLNYNPGPQVQINPGSPNYSAVNWDQLLQQQSSQPSTAGDTAYRPPIQGLLGRLPPAQLINGISAIAQGHFLDGTPIGRILASLGHAVGGTLGQHGNDTATGSGVFVPGNLSARPGGTPANTSLSQLGQPIGTRYGLPDYGVNPANYPTDWSYGGPQTGPGAPHRGDIVGYRHNEPVFQGGRVAQDTRLSGSAYDAASRAQNAQVAAFQSSGGYNTGVNTGTTQDTGHTDFGAQSHTHGLMSDGVIEIQPGGIYETVFRNAMGAGNPNAFRGSGQLPAAPAHLAAAGNNSQNAFTVPFFPSVPSLPQMPPWWGGGRG